MELAVPIGVYWSPDTPSRHTAFAAGIDMRFLFPL
jgi:hypothetical protein